MVIDPFKFARIPHIIFGAGEFHQLANIITGFGKTVLIVADAHSFHLSAKWDGLITALGKSIDYFTLPVTGEPSPGLIDDSVSKFKQNNVDVVLAIGGGSVVDTGKAISAMLLQDGSVLDYLEDVGTDKPHSGIKVPFIAVPTTAGTGSETTKNAVLSRVGVNGFKKSLRHDNFVPDLAVIDPELMLTCPANVTAACGMDAFTQLLESYVSSKATPMTDALAWSGLEQIKDNLIPACSTGANNIQVRAGMAYAALVSGITLANAGLGIIHGIAGPLGGFFPIPHGVACGTLAAPAIKLTIQKLRKMADRDNIALQKFARVGALLSENRKMDRDDYCDALIDRLYDWSRIMKLPVLSQYGIGIDDIDKIINASSNKNNPIKLDGDEIKRIIVERLA